MGLILKHNFLFWCQREVGDNVNGHPVLLCDDLSLTKGLRHLDEPEAAWSSAEGHRRGPTSAALLLLLLLLLHLQF